MKKIVSILDRFFFEEISASGFGLLRIAWAAIVLVFMLGMHADVVRYYSDIGIVPPDLGHIVFRSEYRFTILDYISDPSAILALYWSFMLCLVFMMLGIAPRLMTIICVLLLFSFHERNLQILAGGDTVLRNLGFILMIAPGISAFSLSRLRKQWKYWQSNKALLPPLKMSIWPYRLVLWQYVIIYITSGWDKLAGDMWLNGTVVEAGFHHTHFFRYSKAVQDTLGVLSPIICYYWLVYEFLWALMLVPRNIWSVIPERIRRHSIKRFLLFCGIVSHGIIFIVFEVGAFSFIMTFGYLGLLLGNDFAAFKQMCNRKWKGKITVLYDGTCNLCEKSIFHLRILDRLDRLNLVNFCDSAQRSKHAPDIFEEDLNRAMHIKMPNGSVYKGFYAFRKLSWNLPSVRLITPLLYIPGVAPIGSIIYSKIAKSRNRGSEGVCEHKMK